MFGNQEDGCDLNCNLPQSKEAKFLPSSWKCRLAKSPVSFFAPAFLISRMFRYNLSSIHFT